MRAFLALLLAAAVLVWTPRVAARQLSPRNASYTLTATLDPVNSAILGSGRVVWRNTSKTPTTELRFHMYWNAWRDPSSSWLREQAFGGKPALARRPTEDLGLIDLTALALADAPAESLLPHARYVAPDDGNESDQTVLAVALPRPVAPGETLTVDYRWNAHVPRSFARTGALGNFFFIAQWFPKLGVLEDSGWNCHQFHAATEFFSDYGVYDVQLTVPTGWTVGATGREATRTDNGNGTTTHRYVQEDVHDFAWTTSPAFLDLKGRFDEPGLPAVDLRLLLQPEHRDQADRHFAAARAALKSYGQWFGPYPYGHLTIVDPVTIFNADAQGEGSDGMEYPTLITAGTRWIAPWKGTEPEGVTVHEAGHQFWYGLVGTNEFEHAWMDEGINTYATARVMEEAFPDRFVAVQRYFGGFVAWPYQDVPLSREVYGNRLDSYRLAPAWDALSTSSWRGYPGTVRSIIYAKTALSLTSLERILGWETMQRVLSAFFERGRFRHPTPEEFFATASEVSGQDLTWFFDAVFRQAVAFDYGIEKVVEQQAVNGSTDTSVIVRRLADGIFPIEVRTTFDDGASVTERWNGAERWHAFRYRRGSKVKTVEIDPDRVLTLDTNYTNNSWTARPRAAEAAEKWSVRWLTWLEQVLLTYAFFA